LAAACDNLGRVLVVDVSQGIVSRIFKGCRDAEVAWTTSSSVSTLVVHSPRRFVVEGWQLQQEQKVRVAVIPSRSARKFTLL
jgi:hypothetical protein